MTEIRFKEGMRVRVTTRLVDSSGWREVAPDDGDELQQHPQAGKTGTITELLGVRVAIGKPRAMVKIDPGFNDAGNIMIVSLEYLEEFDGSAAEHT